MLTSKYATCAYAYVRICRHTFTCYHAGVPYHMGSCSHERICHGDSYVAVLCVCVVPYLLYDLRTYYVSLITFVYVVTHVLVTSVLLLRHTAYSSCTREITVLVFILIGYLESSAASTVMVIRDTHVFKILRILFLKSRIELASPQLSAPPGGR